MPLLQLHRYVLLAVALGAGACQASSNTPTADDDDRRSSKSANDSDESEGTTTKSPKKEDEDRICESPRALRKIDESEPNYDPKLAQTVALGVSIAGAMERRYANPYEGHDYYHVVVPRKTTVKITFQTTVPLRLAVLRHGRDGEEAYVQEREILTTFGTPSVTEQLPLEEGSYEFAIDNNWAAATKLPDGPDSDPYTLELEDGDPSATAAADDCE